MAVGDIRQRKPAPASANIKGTRSRRRSSTAVSSGLARASSYRILVIAPTPFFVDRGGHVLIYEQARALQQLGNTVEVCTYHIGRDMPGIVIHRIPKVSWYTKTDAGPAWGKLYLMLLLFFLSWREMRRFKPTILHGHGWDGCWIAYALHILTGVSFIFNMQGSLTGEVVEHGYAKTKGVFFGLLKRIERRTLHLGRVVVPSDHMLASAVRDFGVCPDRIYHTFDGVDTEDLHPAVDPGNLRAKLNIPADRKLVVFLGLLKTYQGVDVLLDAVRILVNELGCANAHFLIMGFPNADKYATKADTLGISAYTTFPGKIDYKRRKYYYALGDVAVAPKLTSAEGNGKIYDYLAMGLPIVTFDSPVSKGILGDARSLAEAVHLSLTDEARANELGRCGRALAVEKYSWLSVGKRLMIAYKDSAAQV
ncbi:MAG: glycosyltransferase family 4 protein [Aggregatilineales bacterium]